MTFWLQSCLCMLRNDPCFSRRDVDVNVLDWWSQGFCTLIVEFIHKISGRLDKDSHGSYAGACFKRNQHRAEFQLKDL